MNISLLKSSFWVSARGLIPLCLAILLIGLSLTACTSPPAPQTSPVSSPVCGSATPPTVTSPSPFVSLDQNSNKKTITIPVGTYIQVSLRCTPGSFRFTNLTGTGNDALMRISGEVDQSGNSYGVFLAVKTNTAGIFAQSQSCRAPAMCASAWWVSIIITDLTQQQ